VKALAGTSIQTARAIATSSPLAEYTAEPAKRLRPSTCSGQPIATHLSPGCT